MIFVCSYFHIPDFIPFFNFKTNIFQSFFNFVSEHFFAILHWTNDVIQQEIFIMAFIDMF